MPKDYELDRLRAEQESLFQRKQAAFQSYAAIRDRANAAHNEMQSAWDERTVARERMNQEFEARKSAYRQRDEVWSEYGRIRDYNNARIDALRSEADSEHMAMQQCFEQASDAYEYGNKSEAPYYASEGHMHKDRRNELNAEIQCLVQEVREAKSYAQSVAPRVDSAAFDHAKADFERAKAYHEQTQARFRQLKSERDRAKDEFDRLQEAHAYAKGAFQKRLGEVRSRKEDKVRKVERAIMPATGRFDGHAAKIKERNDGSGKTDVFFGGTNLEGDGAGHGHAVIDANGQVVYLRGQYQNHEDWQINDMAGLPDKNGRTRFPGDHTKI